MQIESFDDPPIQNADTPFLDRLSLKRVDRDIFTGWCHAGAPLRAFGGQVAAQALVAAGTTVQQDRHVHSLHSYFLRPGRTRDHIVYQVDRPRDGRSFSTRRVRAVQYGEIIFTMSASFGSDQSGPEHETPLRDGEGHEIDMLSRVPPPSRVPARDTRLLLSRDPVDPTAEPTRPGPGMPLIDLRLVDTSAVRASSAGRWDRMAWVRTRERLPDAGLVQVCALTYLSDLLLVGTVLSHHGGESAARDRDLASMDHAMWFHRSFRSDQWLLFATRSPIAGHGRGFAHGQFHTPDGALVASVAQEVLIRDRHQ